MKSVLRAAPLVVTALATAARAQDDAGRAPRPTQDAEGLAALARLLEMSPSPASAGVKSIECSVLPLDGPPAPVKIDLRWTADAPAQVSVGFAKGSISSEAAARATAMLRARVGLPFTMRTWWDAATVARSGVSAVRKDGVLAVTVADGPGAQATLSFGAAGLPQSVSGATPDGPIPRFQLTFAASGRHQALTALRAEQGGSVVEVGILHFDVVPALPMPRRIEWRFDGGQTESYLLFDVVIDGKPVPGTTPLEALAGHARRVDPRAAAALTRWDAALASPLRAGVRHASCRATYTTPTASWAFRAAWTPQGTESCTLDAEGPPPQGEAGMRAASACQGFGAATAGMLQPASAEFAGYDLDVAEDGSIVATALDPAAPVGRRTLRFDASGVLASEEQEGRTPGKTVVTRVHERRGSGFVLVEETVVRDEERATTRSEYHDVPGFPPLRKSVERTVSGPTGTRRYRQAFFDWVVDGRAVPGTAREAPK